MERKKVTCFFYKSIIVLSKVIPFCRIVETDSTAGAKALPKPPGVLDPVNISGKNEVLKWHITLIFHPIQKSPHAEIHGMTSRKLCAFPASGPLAGHGGAISA